MKIETLMEHLKQVDTVKLILSGVGSTSYSSEEIYNTLENEIKLAKHLQEERDKYAEMYFKAQKKVIDYSYELIEEKKSHAKLLIVNSFSRMVTIFVIAYWITKLFVWTFGNIF